MGASMTLGANRPIEPLDENVFTFRVVKNGMTQYADGTLYASVYDPHDRVYCGLIQWSGGTDFSSFSPEELEPASGVAP